MTNSGIWNLKQVRDGQANAQYGPAPILESITGTVIKGVSSTIDLFGIFGTVNNVFESTVRFISGATVEDVLATPANNGTSISSVSVPSAIYNLSAGTVITVKVIVKNLESNVLTFTIAAPTLGASYLGGYYAGDIDIGGGTCYYLILAPNATGCFCCVWKTTNTHTAGTYSTTDGYANTYTYLNNATHPAGNFTATRTIGGFSDWYLPATGELQAIYANKGSLPAGEGFVACNYWASCNDAGSPCSACEVSMSAGTVQGRVKARYGFPYFGRAVRRVPI